MAKNFRERTIDSMVESLKDELTKHGLSLSDIKGLTPENFNTFLDDLFGDGGEVRCDKFTDLAHPYSLKCGALESPEFDKAQFGCIRVAIYQIVEEAEEAEAEEDDDIDEEDEGEQNDPVFSSCKHCGCYIDLNLAVDPPGTYPERTGHKDSPRSPGDWDDVCEVCNYDEGKRGGIRSSATYTGDGLEWDQ